MSTLAEREFLLSGEFHYFRVPRGEWRNRLDTMAAAGLRTASIYVPWNWHAPAPDVTDFTGKQVPERDLAGALREIAAAGLECVFRPGPFITAEWRNGGHLRKIAIFAMSPFLQCIGICLNLLVARSFVPAIRVHCALKMSSVVSS